MKSTGNKSKWIVGALAIAVIAWGLSCSTGVVEAQGTLTEEEQLATDLARFTEPVIPQYQIVSMFFVVKANVWVDTEALTRNFYIDSKNKYDVQYDTLGGYSNMRFRPQEEVSVQGFEDQVYVCELNIVAPQTYYDPNWYVIGHEFGHCLFGQWHKPSLTLRDDAE